MLNIRYASTTMLISVVHTNIFPVKSSNSFYSVVYKWDLFQSRFATHVKLKHYCCNYVLFFNYQFVVCVYNQYNIVLCMLHVPYKCQNIKS